MANLGLVLVVVVLLVLPYVMSTSNAFERQKVKITEADSGIDVALTKRYDTLTKMFEAAQGYLEKEQEAILQTVRLRAHMPMAEKQQAEQALSQAAQQAQVVLERYPELKAQSLFSDLQKAVADTEEHLQAARRLYNANVSLLNQKVAVFPSSLVARLKGIKKQPMFEAEAHKREDVSLKM